MKLTKQLPQTEVDEFIKKSKNKSYSMETRNGQIIKLETNDQSLITWAKSKRLVLTYT